MQEKHIIKRQVIEIAAMDTGTRDRWTEALRALFWQKMLPVIDEVCNEFAPSGSLYRVERLEVDLGHVDWEDLASPVTTERLRHQLYKAFTQTQGVLTFVQTAPISDFRQEKDSTEFRSTGDSPDVGQTFSQTSSQADKSHRGTSAEDLFFHLIRTGLLPWWAEEDSVQNLPAQIEALPEAQWGSFWRDTVVLLQQEIYRKRLISLFPDKALVSIFSTWEPLTALVPTIREWLTIHILLAKRFSMPAPIVRHVVWEALLSAGPLNVPTSSGETALHLHIVSALADRSGQSLEAVISQSRDVIASHDAILTILPDWFASPTRDVAADFAISQILDNRPDTPDPKKRPAAISEDVSIENAPIEPVEKEMESTGEQAESISGKPTSDIVTDFATSQILDNLTVTPDPRKRSAAVSKDVSTENAPIEPVEKEMESLSEQAESISGKPTSHIKDAEHSLDISKKIHLSKTEKEPSNSGTNTSAEIWSKTQGKQPEPSPEGESTIQTKDANPLSDETRTLTEKKAVLWNRRFSQSEEIYVNNAGLVILAPYLTRFFNNLEWLNEKEFINTDLQQRALVLLQCLADGTMEAPEYRLPLNKLLSGWPLETPLDPQKPLNEEEQAAAEVLLTAVIGHAQVLRDMSPESFRNTFLRREGVLKYNDPYWLLRVKRETYDIILDQFPWSFNIIKLPWMATALYVEW